MQIEDQRAVAIAYVLTLDGGIVVDASEKDRPLWYLHGRGNLIPGLERELVGLSAGAKKTVVVEPADGYGEKDPAKVQQVPKAQFPATTRFALGDHVEARDPQGRTQRARIVAIAAKEVTVDMNHELAGKRLTFEVEVKEVREADAEELAHGHVHGPGAHQH